MMLKPREYSVQCVFDRSPARTEGEGSEQSARPAPGASTGIVLVALQQVLFKLHYNRYCTYCSAIAVKSISTPIR